MQLPMLFLLLSQWNHRTETCHSEDTVFVT